MLIINKNKPFYIDNINKIIRMGNFTDTGKEIEYDDEGILSIFNNIQKPISINDLINKVNEETGINKKEIKSARDYLVGEKFIIEFEKYQRLINDTKYNRQNLFSVYLMMNIKYLINILNIKIF